MSESHRALVESATLEVEKIEDLDRSRLLEILGDQHFAVIRGLVRPEDVDRARALMAERFRVEDDHATTGETPADVRDVFQKLSIGRARHGAVDRPRFMRCFYLPMWADDVFGMREHFRKVAQVRNLLGNRPLDFATTQEEAGVWTASRIHQFPAGGGFMVQHRDTVLPKVYEDAGLGMFFQPLLLLSQKGTDYQTGGGFVQVRGEHVLFEDYARKGDIALYDTTTDHGVEDVDPDVPFRQDSLAGRMSALVTLFQTR